MEYKVSPKENFYFTLKLIFCIPLYALLAYGIYLYATSDIPPQFRVLELYVVLVVVFFIMRMGLLIGYLKGNAVRINEHQLPEIYEIAQKQCAALAMSKVPQLYLMQAGGLLNAYATRFLGVNYVVIYSDVLEEAYENNMQAVEFIIGHELGHVKRKHMLKRTLLLPSSIIPFLGLAYSRACEYTCDNIGAALSPKGARNGLLLLAAGKRLYKKINAERFMFQSNTENGFWFWLTEKLSSHPKLSKRVLQFKGEEFASIIKQKPVIVETIDHSYYLPKN